MKKNILILLLSLFAPTTLWAITPKDINSYATRLTLPNGATMSSSHTVDVKFYVMAPTKGVWVYLDADDDGSFETTIYENSNLELGKNEYKTVTCTLPQSLAPGEYRWAVKVQGKESHKDWTVPQAARNYENDDKRYLFGQAMGVAVDCSYDSPYFGYSYVTESHGGTTTGVKFSDGKTYSRTTSDGIYIFGPAMGKVDGASPYVGGVSWCTESKNYEHGPFRVCTDDEGYVYVCENLRSADYPDDILVRRMHPSDLTKNLEAVLMQSHVPSGIAERVHSIAVTRNANRQKVLYAILGGTTSTGILTENSGRLCSFILDDTGNSISITHQRTVNLYTAGLISIYSSIAPGINGDVWVAQHRGSKDGNPVLIHIDNAGTIDYTLSSSTRYNLRGAVALSKDGSIIAIPTIYDSKHVVRCYQVSYGSTNVSLTGLYNIQIPIMNGYTGNEFVESMAFDVANNLYFVSGNNSDQGVDRLYVYALPKTDNSHTTPARSALPIIVPGKEIIWHPYPTRPNDYATDAAYNEWIGKTFSTAVTPGYTPPTITRDGYILAGWYYGNATTYDISDPYNSSAPKGGHLWARWIKATFEEGYITASLASDSYSQQEIEAGKANRNMELASYLSQNPTYLPSHSLQVNRKLQGGMYNTFMLPFTLTSALRDNIIDNGRQPLAEDAILTMQRVESHTANGETIYELVFAHADEVPAYQPFLIKPTNDLTATITFPNVPSVEALPVQPAAEIEGVRFVPVFEPTMIGGEESNILILVADNCLAQLSGSGEMLGLRGYFDAGNTLPSASYVMKIVDKNGVVTYIGDVTAPQKGSVATKILHNGQIYILRGDEVYTITGTRIR